LGKLKEIITTKDIVFNILKTDEKARNSDNYLFYRVYKKIGEINGVDIEKMSIPTFFLNMKDYEFPTTETIRRTRQYIQSQYPELKGNSNVICHRILNEEIYREHFKS